MKTNNSFYWQITIVVALLLTLPVLIQNGMFMDAVQYCSVARNMSDGYGTFWNPQFNLYNIHNLPAFSEQPPLAFGIMSVFYKLLGDSIYVERFYIIVCLIINALLILNIWKIFARQNQKIENYNWLPILIWITVPIIFWTYRNNMLENTMSIFILAAAFYFISWIFNSKKTLPLIIGGIFVYLAVLTKGLPGFFPLAIPFVGYLVYRNTTLIKTILYTAIPLLTIAVCFSITVVLVPESAVSLKRYFIDRALIRIQNGDSTPTETNILLSLLTQLAAPIIISLILIGYAKRKNISGYLSNRREVILLFIIGLCGSLPVLLSGVQKQFYITPAYPFFAIGFALLWLPIIQPQLNNFLNNSRLSKVKLAVPILLLIILIAVLITNFGKSSRGKVDIAEAEKIANFLPENTIVSSTPAIHSNWNFHCYLIRNHKIYPDVKNKLDYLIIDPRRNNTPDSNYVKVEANLIQYALYKKISTE